MDALIVNNISKTFLVGKKTRKHDKSLFTLKNITFNVKKGETLGIIGQNGCGKTTLLRIISGIYHPDSGYVKTNGKLSPLLQLGTGFQGDLTATENITMNGLLLGLSKSFIDSQMYKILKFAELEKFSDLKLKHFSSGMKARLSFSVAMYIDPEILLVDEILSVGDAAFRQKSYNAFLTFKEKQKTIILTSHNLGMIEKLCDRVLLLDKGTLITHGNPSEIITQYESMLHIRNDHD
jgi:ABC-2 type transport system ATP-binding protein